MGRPLIGRDDVLNYLCGLLAEPRRLVAVVGTPGVGKTALAQAALVNPVVWDLDGVADLSEAFERLTAAVGSKETWLQELGERWLWIDHAERWQEPIVAWLEEQWQQTPNMKVCWTSYLYLPARFGAPITLEPLSNTCALALFAQLVSPTGRLPDGWGVDAAKLVGYTDGLPLALEIAASWTALFTPSELLRTQSVERWLLCDPQQPERSERLQRVFDASWSLLTDDQKRLAHLCATRSSGALLEDVEEAAVRLGLEDQEVAVGLHRLRSHMWLHARSYGETERQRLTLYAPLRAFLAKFPQSETQHIVRLADEVLVERAEQRQCDIEGATPLHTLRWLEAERSNLLAIVERERDVRPEWAARAALVLAPLLTTREPWAEHHQILRDAFRSAKASRIVQLRSKAAYRLSQGLARHGAFSEADQVLRGNYDNLSGPGAEQHTVRCLITHAHVVAWLDHEAQAERLLERAARLLSGALPTEDQSVHTSCGHLDLQRAFLALRKGGAKAHREAYQHIERATALADTKGLCRLSYICRYIRGQVLLKLDQPDAAYASLQAAVEGLVSLGETCSEATGLQWMAQAARRTGDVEQARVLLTRGQLLARERADLESELYLQAEWVEHYLSQQQFYEARLALQEARRLAARSRLPPARKIPDQLQSVLGRLQALVEEVVPPGAQIQVARDASGWHCHGAWVSLQTRPTVRRVFVRLCEARERAPGQMVNRETLFAAGWPTESIQPRSQHQRVYTTIWMLRRLGLGDALLSDTQGYALCPARTTLVMPEIS